MQPTIREHHEGNGESGFTGLLVELSAAVGSLAEQVKNGNRKRPVIPWEACHPVGPVGAVILSAGAGTFDVPDLLGPHDPYWWDLRRFAAWGFTAGSVSIYKNNSAGNLLGTLAAPGNITWSAQELFAPRDRLIVVATSITGSVQFELRAIEVMTEWLPEYLL